jgi:hypothetical protein
MEEKTVTVSLKSVIFHWYVEVLDKVQSYLNSLGFIQSLQLHLFGYFLQSSENYLGLGPCHNNVCISHIGWSTAWQSLII